MTHDLNEQDLEQLELQLDNELPADASAALDARLASDATLRAERDRLQADRATRLSAMSYAFDTDAAAVERLVASVRTAQASEALAHRRRFTTAWLRPALSAAACVAFGLGLGIVLHKQHATPATSSVSAGMSPIGPVFNNNADLNTVVGNSTPQQAYVVALRDASGNIVARLQFPSREQAEAFINQANRRSNGVLPINAGDAKVLERSY